MSIYLDHAATSFPKPLQVVTAVQQAMQEHAGYGRGTTRFATRTQQAVNLCRQKLARFFDTPYADHFIFTANGTGSLNWVIHGLIQTGQHVITTQLEHNSVMRPLQSLQFNKQIEVTSISPELNGQIEPENVLSAIQPNTSLIIITHASNVTGVVQPLAEIVQIANQHNIPILVDAAQTAGNLPISLSQLSIDFLAAPGHKGLLGPLGTGILYIKPGRGNMVYPLLQGGTGAHSLEDVMHIPIPDRFEPGNLNVPGILGLSAALDYLLEQVDHSTRWQQRHQREMELWHQLHQGLSKIPGVTIYPKECTSSLLQQVALLSITHENWDAHELAIVLEQQFDIQVRAGLHCSPAAHAYLGTLPQGGTVRFSLGDSTSESDIFHVLSAMQQL